jgi:hypothetical protein
MRQQTTPTVLKCISIIKLLGSLMGRIPTKKKVVKQFAARPVATVLILLTSPAWFGVVALTDAKNPLKPSTGQGRQDELGPLRSKQQIDDGTSTKFSFPLDSSRGHIEEVISGKYRRKYQTWKKEFLATETGRRQWEAFDHHPTLTLIITVSQDWTTGALTGKFKWDDAGNLTNATITLGCSIDSGSPNPIYYPVLSSLKRLDPFRFGGPILAAAKIAHEFEHVNQATSGGIAYRNQVQMTYAYNTLFIRNGYNTCDPELVELAAKMGGTPVEIGEAYDFGSETRAMRYLLERLKNDKLRRSLLVSVKKTINASARSFQRPYAQLIQSLGLSRKLLAVALEAENNSPIK